MLSGVILAGGKGTRMGGRNKALLTVGGLTLIERQLAAMERLCPDIVIVANDPAPLANVIGGRCRIVADVHPGCGPLGGMHAAFPHCRHEAVWVVGCDMPFLSGRAALRMLGIWEKEAADAVVPTDGAMLHPLHGIYAKRVHFSLAESIRHNRLGVQQWLGTLRTVTVDFGADESCFWRQLPFWTNVNTPEELAAAERLGRSEHTCLN